MWRGSGIQDTPVIARAFETRLCENGTAFSSGSINEGVRRAATWQCPHSFPLPPRQFRSNKAESQQSLSLCVFSAATRLCHFGTHRTPRLQSYCLFCLHAWPGLYRIEACQGVTRQPQTQKQPALQGRGCRKVGKQSTSKTLAFVYATELRDRDPTPLLTRVDP